MPIRQAGFDGVSTGRGADRVKPISAGRYQIDVLPMKENVVARFRRISYCVQTARAVKTQKKGIAGHNVGAIR